MSVLTKIFVVLNAILTVVMASGLIVFVSRQDDWNKKVADAHTAEVTQREARLAAEQMATAAAGERDLAVQNITASVRALEAEVAKADQARKTAEASVTSTNEENTRMKAEVATANQAASNAMATINQQQQTINQIANEARARQKDVADLQTQVAGNIREIEGLRATNRRQKEEIATLNTRLNEATSVRNTSQAGTGREQQPGAGVANAMPAEAGVNLRGVVKARKNINGIEYATISLGAGQHVAKGMRFNVTDGSQFLGYLTVDLVETDESVGHMEGPSLNLVRPGTQVRTQW